MRIVFMGTPDFAVKSLKRIYDDGHSIVGVFTQPDRPRGRGMKVSYSPVKKLAVSLNLPVFQPVSLKNEETAQILSSLECDLLIVVAYGRILPKEILDIPILGSINIHASLLPKYRGAAPIQWAIMNGEVMTGVTSMYISEELDSGDMIYKKQTPIGENETSGELHDRLSIMGADLLSETIQSVLSGNTPRIPQDHSRATSAPLITKDIAYIDWNESVHSIKCKVRGLCPKPAATAIIDGTNLKVFSVEIGSESPVEGSLPGEVLSKGVNGIEIACSNGSLHILELQPPGRKRMEAAAFLRGLSNESLN